MTDTLASACNRTFARHETFHPRYGWFRKGVVAATRDAGIFLDESATVTLGVGKNMVRAIRFWGEAAKLLAEQPNPARPRVPLVVPTQTGQALFGEGGADPFLEAPGTLWLLHWQMLQPPCDLPVWWLAFNRFTAVEFTEESLVQFVLDEINRVGWEAPKESSIRKDVTCLFRTYAAVAYARSTIDDLLDCPLRQLGVLERISGNESGFRFLHGPKPGLPPDIVLYAVLDWMASQNDDARTVSTARLVYEPGSPGKAFHLSEKAMVESLNVALETHKLGSLTVTAGSTRLAVNNDPAGAANSVLATYYRSIGMTLRGSLGVGTPASYSQGLLPMAVIDDATSQKGAGAA